MFQSMPVKGEFDCVEVDSNVAAVAEAELEGRGRPSGWVIG
jgi:hypothetical protein